MSVCEKEKEFLSPISKECGYFICSCYYCCLCPCYSYVCRFLPFGLLTPADSTSTCFFSDSYDWAFMERKEKKTFL